ncbi:MAG TPA: hypothetical protein DEB24_04265 [Coriobacteriia bacterium]|nr:hypothetical protein [Coriobacteriia bacterium]
MGWKTADGASFTPSVIVTQHTVVYAQWQVVQITITFNHNYDGAPIPTTVLIDYGTSVGSRVPADPARGGYTFEGWASASGVPLNTNTILAADTTFHAQWRIIPVPGELSVTFNLNYNGMPEAPVSIVATEGTSLGSRMPDVPMRVGYTFTGWNTKPDGTGDVLTASDVIRENTYVYAQWSAVPAAPVPNTPTTPNAPVVNVYPPEVTVAGGGAAGTVVITEEAPQQSDEPQTQDPYVVDVPAQSAIQVEPTPTPTTAAAETITTTSWSVVNVIAALLSALLLALPIVRLAFDRRPTALGAGLTTSYGNRALIVDISAIAISGIIFVSLATTFFLTQDFSGSMVVTDSLTPLLIFGIFIQLVMPLFATLINRGGKEITGG